MVNTEEIVFNEPVYYVPEYSGVIKVSIIKLLDDGKALIKQASKKKDLKPFPTPMAYIYNSSKDAYRGRRAWESYKRKSKKELKTKNSKGAEK